MCEVGSDLRELALRQTTQLFLYKKPREEAEAAKVRYKQQVLKPRGQRQSKQNRGREKAEGFYARPRDAAPLGRLRRKESGFGRRRS